VAGEAKHKKDEARRNHDANVGRIKLQLQLTFSRSNLLLSSFKTYLISIQRGPASSNHPHDSLFNKEPEKEKVI